MKSSFLATALLAVVVPSGGLLFAQHEHKTAPKAESPTDAGKLIRVTAKEAGWAAKARETYPLSTCVVADEKLGSMGETPAYIYRVEGKPDRLVLFCCAGCEEDFVKEPAKHVAKLDAAANGKTAPAKKSDAPSDHGAHKHE